MSPLVLRCCRLRSSVVTEEVGGLLVVQACSVAIRGFDLSCMMFGQWQCMCNAPLSAVAGSRQREAAGAQKLAMAMAQATSSWRWLATLTLAGAHVCSDESSKSPRLRKYRVLRCQNGQLRPADLGSAVPSSQLLLVACMYTAGEKKVKSAGRYAAKMGSLGQQILVLLCHRHNCYWWHACMR